MSRRLVADAKIVLEKAGYAVQAKTRYMNINNENRSLIAIIWIENSTVDNQEVVDLLARRGFDEYGRKI